MINGSIGHLTDALKIAVGGYKKDSLRKYIWRKIKITIFPRK